MITWSSYKKCTLGLAFLKKREIVNSMRLPVTVYRYKEGAHASKNLEK
jgi:hypothetical protein